MGTDLKAFCAAEDAGRYALSEPWVVDGWRYATNGRIIIRAPAPDEPDTLGERLFQSPGSWFFGRGKHTAEGCTVLFPVHAGKMQERPCRHDHRSECSFCDGGGTCTRCECGDEHVCAACEGTGKNPEYKPLPDCECGGTGMRLVPAPMSIGGKLIAGKYVVLIGDLPNARYDPDGASDRQLSFRADGGLEGMVARIK